MGEMLHSVFVVPCSTHVRLEYITPQRTWARDVTLKEGGSVKERKKGEAIPNGLMESWLDLRDEEP